MDLVRFVFNQFPNLRHDLISAHMSVNPHDFVKKTLTSSFMYAACFSILAFFPLDKAGLPPALAIISFPPVFIFMLTLQMNVPRATIRKRGLEIDNEVLFAGRFLLIKLGSGKPLFNALIDISQSYGVAAKYFKEIVDDINFGTPIEQALNNAQEHSASKYFKKILFQINNSIKVGVDITRNLELVIEEIEQEQALEIQRYSKKLSSIALFYMLGAIVLPSLGMTLFIVVASMLSFEITTSIYVLMIIFIVGIQFFFSSVFRQIRPSVNV
ncbi:MAG TPA: type II secretion system F family protein [Acidobacteriota bacterium]|nr:type II secretion system F family protein [Acidobacteriota bacterium]